MAKKSAEIKLYGDISSYNENSANFIVSQLEKLKANNDSVLLRMHCYGGEVFEGNAIANCIQLDNKVSVQIDGIAASMGAFLLPYAKHVSIAENGFIMLHAPSTGFCGSADEMEKQLKLLKSLEVLFVAQLKKKTKQSEKNIRGWLDGENWFTATEAKQIGLVDEIIAPAENVAAMKKEDLQAKGIKNVFSQFKALANFNNNSKSFSMDKKDLIVRFGLSSVTAESSDTDVFAALDNVIKAERTAKESAENALKAQKDSKIVLMVQTAIDAKKITEQQKETFVNIGKTAGVESLQAALNAISTTPTITGMLHNGGTGAQSPRADWDFDKWQKEDAKGLETLAKQDYEAFNALYKVKFGVQAPK